ncbi:TIM21-domain-containing protein [Bisporella sp. PMI_857]|nr:TIM21-domain-containing protein [Bisporella sp. PMI_857]
MKTNPLSCSRITSRALLSLPVALRPLVVAQSYATQTGLGATGPTPRPRRKTVTAFNDDGRVAWGELSGMEKAARTTQQSFNFGMIVIGIALTGGVGYYMYAEVFSPNSKTTHFNKAVNQVKKDPKCLELLGDSKKIVAHGQGQVPKGWRHDRQITAINTRDKYNVEHLKMNIAVEGPLNNGVVSMHMIKRPSDSQYIYKYLFLDVQGHPRIYLENADASADSPAKSKVKFFGINWS